MPSHPYEYSSNVDAPPHAGEVRANGYPAADVTELYVSVVPAGTAELLALDAGDLVRLELVIDASWYHEWSVSGAPVDLTESGYVRVPVSGGVTPVDDPFGYALLVLPAAPVEPPAVEEMPALGPRDVYASMADLEARIGAAVGAAQVRARELALIAGTRWVAYRVGTPVTDALLDSTTPSTGVDVVPAKAAWTYATIEAAVRFYKGPDVPWGVAGGWDEAVYVRQGMPEVELVLLGHRQRWGIA